MADSGNIETMLASLDPDTRRVFKEIFDYLLKNLRLGRAVNGDASENFGAGFFKGTTASTANDEFSIAHTFGRAPYLLIPVLPLDTVNARMVDLKVSRAADSSRVYLKSSVASAPIFVYLEG